jgi:hydrogenase expression/formation protein HypD
LRLREAFATWDATRRFAEIIATAPSPPPRAYANECLCGAIMTGSAVPTDCRHFGKACQPPTPVGACMVSSEGVCRIWHEHGLGKLQPSAEAR